VWVNWSTEKGIALWKFALLWRRTRIADCCRVRRRVAKGKSFSVPKFCFVKSVPAGRDLELGARDCANPWGRTCWESREPCVARACRLDCSWTSLLYVVCRRPWETNPRPDLITSAIWSIQKLLLTIEKKKFKFKTKGCGNSANLPFSTLCPHDKWRGEKTNCWMQNENPLLSNPPGGS